MKNSIIFLFICFSFFNCQLQEQEKCIKPDFYKWKQDCLLILNKQFDSDTKSKGGTIIESIRNEITNIESSKQESFFCDLEKYPTHWDSLTFIYHYMEGEINYAVESFIFHSKSKCELISWNISSNQVLDENSCIEEDVLNELSSDYINSGLVVVSHFDRKFTNTKTELYIGTSNKKLVPLIKKYPR